MQITLGDKIVYPRDEVYTESVNGTTEDLETGYWSITAQLTPECIVKAQSTEDVSVAVTTLTTAQTLFDCSCKFAVRGGGHTPWPANNIENGVTIDLSWMNKTRYNADSSTATIGAGSRWVQVYEELSPLGVAVPGGRAGTVGVAGLTLGGGNSFFAARAGLVCDNVANFEVCTSQSSLETVADAASQLVTASGEIINANNGSHPDLWQALKGGSNNLGIVTHFELFAFKQGDLWGGVVILPGNATDDLIPAIVNFNNGIRDDPFGSLISFWQYSNWVGSTNIINAWEYTKPVANPPVFDELRSISGNNLTDTMRITNMTDLTAELVQAYGYRDSFHTLTFNNDARILHKGIELHNGFVEKLEAGAGGNWTIVTMYQPFPTLFFEHGVEKGGNILGLDRNTGENLVLFQIDLSWQRQEDDALFDEVGQSMIDELGAFAKSIGGLNEYVYLPYAYHTQNPLAGYGQENLQKLRQVAKKYDPRGVFQKDVPGGFKLTANGGTVE